MHGCWMMLLVNMPIKIPGYAPHFGCETRSKSREPKSQEERSPQRHSLQYAFFVFPASPG